MDSQEKIPRILYLLEAQNRTLGAYSSLQLATEAAEKAHRKSLAGWAVRAESYSIKTLCLDKDPERQSLTVAEIHTQELSTL